MYRLLTVVRNEVVGGIKRWSLIRALAKEDIHDQHRQTALGPAWLLVNYLAFAGSFVLLFGETTSIGQFGAFVAIGLFVWLYISEVISLSTSLFVREKAFILGTTLPLSVYIMRMTVQSLIRSSYALVGCVAILMLANTTFGWQWMWSVAGMALIASTTPAVVTIFAIAGSLFPDVSFIVGNIMRIGLFLTPIFWSQADGIRATIYFWNPFTYFLEIVRKPVIDLTFPAGDWGVCIVISALSWCLALYLLGKYRRKIPFLL